LTEPAGARHPEGLPKHQRLAKRREFLRVYELGRKIFARYSVLFYAPNELPHSRLGITATKKAGNAVLRNKYKRWSRETYRRHQHPLGLDTQPIDVVINVKANAADASFRDFSDDLTRSLRRVVQEARKTA
jgi:ribonuclease P protein component